MRKFILFIAISIGFSSCVSTTYKPLQNTYNQEAKSISSTASFETLKQRILQKGAVIISEASGQSITFELRNTSWSWERKGKVLKPQAYVVIKTFKDWGANRIKTPKSVVSTWKLSIEKSIPELKLLNVTANYIVTGPVADNDAGYSLGNLENELADPK